MKYAILVYERAVDFDTRTDAEHAGAYWGAYAAYSAALREAGVMVPAGAALQVPSTATTVRLQGDRRQVQDGPFAETKEQLGGMFVIDVPGLDQAIEWAARCPAAGWAGVEVRPILEMPGA